MFQGVTDLLIGTIWHGGPIVTTGFFLRPLSYLAELSPPCLTYVCCECLLGFPVFCQYPQIQVFPALSFYLFYLFCN